MGLMSGKTCLVTGASSGIGYETALELARQGAALALIGRSAERTGAAAERIQEETHCAPIKAYQADLSAQSDVREVARKVRNDHARLDVLVNNAGAIFDQRELSADGFEKTWALNHLAYVLLTLELLPLLGASAPARVVNVASDAHRAGRITWDDVQGEKSYRSWRAYNQSKLANIMFSYALARRLEGRGVTVNAVHPGVVASGFWRNMPAFLKPIANLGKLMMKSEKDGARTSVFAASSPELEGVTGRYLQNSKLSDSNRPSHDIADQERLWSLSLQQTGARFQE